MSTRIRKTFDNLCREIENIYNKYLHDLRNLFRNVQCYFFTWIHSIESIESEEIFSFRKIYGISIPYILGDRVFFLCVRGDCSCSSSTLTYEGKSEIWFEFDISYSFYNFVLLPNEKPLITDEEGTDLELESRIFISVQREYFNESTFNQILKILKPYFENQMYQIWFNILKEVVYGKEIIVEKYKELFTMSNLSESDRLEIEKLSENKYNITINVIFMLTFRATPEEDICYTLKEVLTRSRECVLNRSCMKFLTALIIYTTKKELHLII